MNQMRYIKAILDGNVYDQFEADSAAADLLNLRIAEGKITVLMPTVVRDELAARPSGLPAWLKTTAVPDGVFVVGVSKVGEARVGDGDVYYAHRGHSAQRTIDAIIAATAHTDAEVFVTEDGDCRKRAAAHSRCECLSYLDFIQKLRSI